MSCDTRARWAFSRRRRFRPSRVDTASGYATVKLALIESRLPNKNRKYISIQSRRYVAGGNNSRVFHFSRADRSDAPRVPGGRKDCCCRFARAFQSFSFARSSLHLSAQLFARALFAIYLHRLSSHAYILSLGCRVRYVCVY